MLLASGAEAVTYGGADWMGRTRRERARLTPAHRVEEKRREGRFTQPPERRRHRTDTDTTPGGRADGACHRNPRSPADADDQRRRRARGADERRAEVLRSEGLDHAARRSTSSSSSRSAHQVRILRPETRRRRSATITAGRRRFCSTPRQWSACSTRSFPINRWLPRSATHHTYTSHRQPWPRQLPSRGGGLFNFSATRTSTRCIRGGSTPELVRVVWEMRWRKGTAGRCSCPAATRARSPGMKRVAVRT